MKWDKAYSKQYKFRELNKFIYKLFLISWVYYKNLLVHMISYNLLIFIEI